MKEMEEAVKLATKIANRLRNGIFKDDIWSIYLAIDSLEKQLNGGWIPVSERLPDVFEYVLTTSNGGGRTIAHRMPNQSNWYDLHSVIVETGVIAWQPLPQPYKEDNK